MSETFQVECGGGEIDTFNFLFLWKIERFFLFFFRGCKNKMFRPPKMVQDKAGSDGAGTRIVIYSFIFLYLFLGASRELCEAKFSGTYLGCRPMKKFRVFVSETFG